VNGSLSTGHCRRTERSMDDGRVAEIPANSGE
jgi:hypothetical protein